MRIFGVVSLLIALVVVGLLAKKQLTGAAPSVAGVPGAQPVASGASPQVQSQQMQAQVKAAVDAAMQQKRPEPDDK